MPRQDKNVSAARSSGSPSLASSQSQEAIVSLEQTNRVPPTFCPPDGPAARESKGKKENEQNTKPNMQGVSPNRVSRRPTRVCPMHACPNPCMPSVAAQSEEGKEKKNMSFSSPSVPNPPVADRKEPDRRRKTPNQTDRRKAKKKKSSSSSSPSRVVCSEAQASNEPSPSCPSSHPYPGPAMRQPILQSIRTIRHHHHES